MATNNSQQQQQQENKKRATDPGWFVHLMQDVHEVEGCIRETRASQPLHRSSALGIIIHPRLWQCYGGEMSR